MLLETSEECLLAAFDLTGAVRVEKSFSLASDSYFRNPQSGDGKRGKHLIATTLK